MVQALEKVKICHISIAHQVRDDERTGVTGGLGVGAGGAIGVIAPAALLCNMLAHLCSFCM